MRRMAQIRLVVWVAVFVCLVFAWFGGGAGLLIRKFILPLYAPRKIGSSFTIYSFGVTPRFEHESRGIMLLISSKRAREILRGALPFAGRYVPPGLFGDGFSAECMWLPDGEKGSSMAVIPVWIVIDDNVGYAPVLKGRMPVDELNRYLDEELGDSLSSREEWIFGHYDLIYKISFDHLRILSDTGAGMGENRRKLRLFADGRVRIKFDDTPVSARSTADVKELNAEIDMTFLPRGKEYALAYDARVTELRLNVNNVLQWGDTKVAESLRKSLEKSLNRRKNKERAMNLRIPEWAARDMMIDVQLVSESK